MVRVLAEQRRISFSLARHIIECWSLKKRLAFGDYVRRLGVLAVLFLPGCSFTLVRYESYACPPKEKVSDDAKMAKQVHPVVDANCPVVSTLPRDE
jgi:hypothetical protein